MDGIANKNHSKGLILAGQLHSHSNLPLLSSNQVIVNPVGDSKYTKTHIPLKYDDCESDAPKPCHIGKAHQYIPVLRSSNPLVQPLRSRTIPRTDQMVDLRLFNERRNRAFQNHCDKTDIPWWWSSTSPPSKAVKTLEMSVRWRISPIYNHVLIAHRALGTVSLLDLSLWFGRRLIAFYRSRKRRNLRWATLASAPLYCHLNLLERSSSKLETKDIRKAWIPLHHSTTH